MECTIKSFLESHTKTSLHSTILLIYFLSITILSLLFFFPLKTVVTLSLHDEKYSHLIVIPLLSAFFIWIKRGAFPSPKFTPSLLSLLFTGLAVIALALKLVPLFNHHAYIQLDLSMLAFLLFFTAITTFFFTPAILSHYTFSFLLLLLCIPVPLRVLDLIVEFFRHGSAEVVDRLFSLLNMTYIRESLTFHLPNISIYIAKECSGIRSSIALFITILLAGQLFLKTVPGKIVLVLFIPLLTILKNGIRITTLTVLADKVDTNWLTNSHLHHNGGVVFFGIILLLTFGILKILQKTENAILTKKMHSSNVL